MWALSGRLLIRGMMRVGRRVEGRRVYGLVVELELFGFVVMIP